MREWIHDPVYDRVLQRSHIRRPNQNVRRVRLRNRSQWALILDIVDKTDAKFLLIWRQKFLKLFSLLKSEIFLFPA